MTLNAERKTQNAERKTRGAWYLKETNFLTNFASRSFDCVLR
jgi:hypothetical protein